MSKIGFELVRGIFFFVSICLSKSRFESRALAESKIKTRFFLLETIRRKKTQLLKVSFGLGSYCKTI